MTSEPSDDLCPLCDKPLGDLHKHQLLDLEHPDAAAELESMGWTRRPTEASPGVLAEMAEALRSALDSPVREPTGSQRAVAHIRNVWTKGRALLARYDALPADATPSPGLTPCSSCAELRQDLSDAREQLESFAEAAREATAPGLTDVRAALEGAARVCDEHMRAAEAAAKQSHGLGQSMLAEYQDSQAHGAAKCAAAIRALASPGLPAGSPGRAEVLEEAVQMCLRMERASLKADGGASLHSIALGQAAAAIRTLAATPAPGSPGPRQLTCEEVGCPKCCPPAGKEPL